MTFTSSPLRPRRRRHVVATCALALGLLGVVDAVTGPATATAAEPLAVNALAPEITRAAGKAITALEAYSETGDPADARTLAWHRAIAARYTARQLGYDELAMVDAWSSTPMGHQRAVLGALTQVGVPYRSHTSEEGVGFDCSGLTTYAWSGAGVDLYRQSGTQINEAEALERETAKAGDLVYYPGHVMLYLGVEDAVVHSVMTGRTVEVDTISERRRNSVRWGDPTV